MVKRIINLICATAIAVSSALSFATLTASATEDSSTDYSYVLYDESGKLTAEQQESLEKEIDETAYEIGGNIAVYIGGTHRDNDETEEFVKSTTIDLFTYEANSVFYYIDCEGDSEAYDYMYVLGNLQLYYTDLDNSYDEGTGYDCRIDAITHDNIPYLTKGDEDLTGAIDNFCSNLIYYKDKGVVPGAWYYDRESDLYYSSSDDGGIVESTERPREPIILVLGIVGGLVIGLIIALCYYFIIKYMYRFKTAEAASAYVSKDAKEFVNRQDIFIRKTTTKTRHSDSSSGGGGGSHSGGGSGGGCSR